jgi:hypothetical protein
LHSRRRDSVDERLSHYKDFTPESLSEPQKMKSFHIFTYTLRGYSPIKHIIAYGINRGDLEMTANDVQTSLLRTEMSRTLLIPIPLPL